MKSINGTKLENGQKPQKAALHFSSVPPYIVIVQNAQKPPKHTVKCGRVPPYIMVYENGQKTQKAAVEFCTVSPYSPIVEKGQKPPKAASHFFRSTPYCLVDCPLQFRSVPSVHTGKCSGFSVRGPECTPRTSRSSAFY